MNENKNTEGGIKHMLKRSKKDQAGEETVTEETNVETSENEEAKSTAPASDVQEFDEQTTADTEETSLIAEERDQNDDLKVEENKEIDQSKPIVVFDKVSLKYDDELVIDELDLEIYEGEFVYFVGASGAGKSSLAKLVYREINNTGGNIYVDGQNITQLKSKEMPYLRRKVGVIFQDYKLLKDRTIYENVRYSLDVTGYPADKREAQVLKTLERVGILDQKDKYPDELSGGQQQRVAIARAIVDDPKIIVADEPTGNLDPENALQIMEILMNINKTGTTLIMATHDVGIVNIYKNRVVLLKDGKVANEVEGEYIYE